MNQIISYFTDTNIPPDSTLAVIGLYLSLVLLIFGILIPFLGKRISRKRRVAQWLHVLMAWSFPFRVFGALWLALFWLRYESLPLFTNRIWAWALVIPFIIWLSVIYRRERAIIPEIQKEDTLKEHYQKYLPQPKRRA